MEITPENFIKNFKKGKEAALEFVIDEYSGIVKAIIYNSLQSYNDSQVIEECISDTFLGAFENAKQFSGEQEDFRKWICAIAKYKSIDYYRRAAKRMEVSSEHMDMNVEMSVEDELIRVEDKTELIKLINRLEPLDRDIFLMKFFLGYKTADISRKTGLSITAIDNRVFRGKKKLFKEAQSLSAGGFVL